LETRRRLLGRGNSLKGADLEPVRNELFDERSGPVT